MRHARDERGIALVSAIVLLMVIVGLGLALLLYADNQQTASTREQASESAFNLAEAALNAQIGQLARKWPSTKQGGEEFPTCTASTSTGTNGCPDPGSLKAGYPNTNPATCPAGAAADPWGSALTNQWTTYVRDDVGKTPYFSSATEKVAESWNKEANGKLWVRAVGVAQCHFVTLVSLVSRQEIATTFPENASTSNWFETTNNGKKVLVDTKGKSSQPGKVSTRCKEPGRKPCKKYREGQVEPDTTEPGEGPGSPSQTFSTSQMEAAKQQAELAGTYYPTGKCPAGLPSGKLVYVEGPCEVSGGGGETGNSEAEPGFLIIANGTFSMGGNSTFYGVVYVANKQESSEAVVSLHGNAHLFGAIDVDGNGGIEFGSSHENLTYDPTAIKALKLFAGVAPTRNGFRVLPANQ